MKNLVNIEVTAKKGQLDTCKADILCIGMFKENNKLDKITKQLDEKLDGAITNLIKLGDFKGEALSSVVFYTNGKIAVERLMLVGLGEKKKANIQTLRKAASNAANKAVAAKVNNMTCALNMAFGKKFDLTKAGQAMAEGVCFGAYRYDEFMEDKEEKTRSESISVELIETDAASVRKLSKGAAAGAAIGQAQNLARTLSNRPPNVVTPVKLAEEAKKVAATSPNLSCTVFDEKQLKQKKMGGIIAVGQGSVHPPRMIILKYTPKRKKNSETIAFVGKAITFDSGGVSIKPSAKMEEMKMDMTGGAVVLATMKAVADLKLPVTVCGIICSAENAPDGKSYRPSDVITTYSKKTVEVVNTDAEGRMVLCDGIHYAKENGCQPIVDICTLTGACAVALGTHKAGLMGNDKKLIAQFEKASADCGEPLWTMPSGEPYTSELKSKVADLKNIGSRYGGACTAASFLREFAGDTKWAHLDIAGMMMVSEPVKEITTDGSIGFGVRIFVSYLSKIAGK